MINLELKNKLEETVNLIDLFSNTCLEDNDTKNNYKYYRKYSLEKEKVKSIIALLNSGKYTIYKDLHELIEQQELLATLLKELQDILLYIETIYSDYNQDKYGFHYKDYIKRTTYLIKHNYQFKEERENAFVSQLKKNAKEYSIYLKNGLKLINLFDRSELNFGSEVDIENYMTDDKNIHVSIYITPKSSEFEKEFQNYYNYLVKHGYEYTTNKYYGPYKIAEELCDIFDGKMTISESRFPFYTPIFEYPEELNNEEYIKQLQEFLILKHNREFIQDYKIFKLLSENIESIINELKKIEVDNKKTATEIKHNEQCLEHDILFLQKCYEYDIPRFGYSDYTLIDYYKALDSESLRVSLKRSDIGSWKTTKNIVSEGLNKRYNNYVPIHGTRFNWNPNYFCDVTTTHDKRLKSEISSLDYVSTQEEIDELIKDRYVIVANSNLDYDTLMKEYYSNFGMEPDKFTEMIQIKYGCEVKFPNKETQVTKIILRK